MPGRASTRSTRSSTSRATRKSSAQTSGSRASTNSRPSVPLVEIPDEGPETWLRAQICAIFSDGQRTTAGHRKLAIKLRNLQERCCYELTETKGPSPADEFGEEDFNTEITRCVLRLLPIRKSESIGDRMVRFLGFFLKFACDRDAELVPQEDIDDTGVFPETPSTRLTTSILSLLLPLLGSKEKVVRYRATQIISHIINTLDSIDDEYYHLLRLGLMKRVRDREPMIRIQAVLGLGRLAGNEADEGVENDETEDDTNGLTDKLLEILQNDPSAEVRRSLLLNLPLTPATLPYLLERARDMDPATRRALYSRLLPALGDFRHLSLSMREKLLRWGLRDRDENVRKAAGKLFRERWIEDCVGAKQDPEGEEQQDQTHNEHLPDVNGLLELLERIDVVNSGVEDGVALVAMKQFWEGRPDYRDVVSFDDTFWRNLTAESVFMVRTLNDFCRYEGNGKYEALIEEKLPEVTRFAFYLEESANALITMLRNAQTAEEGEDDTVEKEFVVEQLLQIALSLDYSDEVGRRKMFSLTRELLAAPLLPDEITRLVIEVLRELCGHDPRGEGDFCGVVLEAIAEVHDTIVPDDDESFVSARSEISDDPVKRERRSKSRTPGPDGSGEEDEAERAMREIMVNMKCLHVAQCMLQNVEGNLQENMHLVTMLNNLVVPAVRSHEAPIRERGLLCLGLCCMLDKTLAEENLTLFLHCFNKGHEALQCASLQVLCDILATHSSLLTIPPSEDSESFQVQKAVHKVFIKALKATSSPDVQAAGTTALCKLMLLNVIKEEDLLKALMVSFFDPSTQDNAEVRQALSYFLPVYCYSRRENMERMGRIGVNVIHSLMQVSEEMDDEEEMVGMPMVANMIVDWTDARKLVEKTDGVIIWDDQGKHESKGPNGDVHLELARDVLEKVLGGNCPKEEKKFLISMLGKLYLTKNSTPELVQEVYELVTEAVDEKIASDAPSRNALNKLSHALEKIVTSPPDKVVAQGEAEDREGSRSRTIERSVEPKDDSLVPSQAGEDIDQKGNETENEVEKVEEAKEEEDEDTVMTSDHSEETLTVEDTVEEESLGDIE
ncbi:MAG: hypothetical protein M1834_005087 [Cirrosporium novae-zelandiae]|nr:MAG: hypothetical protein M1834_005087 [Cirrosporium novae-zelandiae]